MRFAASLILVAASVLTAGCGPDCQSTCQKLYATDDGGCGLPTPGRDAGEAVDTCEDECSLAVQQPGNIGSYDPLNPSSGTVTELENEKQAAAWMDCIDVTDCTLLARGLCQPRP